MTTGHDISIVSVTLERTIQVHRAQQTAMNRQRNTELDAFRDVQSVELMPSVA